MDPGTDTINCPLCGRAVASDQRVCACGAVVGSEPVPETGDYGRFIPWFGLVGFVVAAWWIFFPGMLYYSMIPLLKLYGCVVILSAVCVMLAARDLQRRNVNIGIPPTSWFAFLVVAWPVAMPYFLLAQYQASQPARMKFGWITTGLFIGALLVLWMIVRQAPTEWPGNMDYPEIPAGVKLDQDGPAPGGRSPVYHQVNPPSAPLTKPAQPVDQSRPVRSTNPGSDRNVTNQPVQPVVSPRVRQGNSSNNGAAESGNSFGSDLPPIP